MCIISRETVCWITSSPTLLFLSVQRFGICPGAVFGYTTLAHKEETHKTDKKGEEAVGQLPAWLGNTPARPPERSPALGNVFAPVGKERLQTQDLYNPQPLFQLPLLLFSWAPRGISEDHPSSHHVMNQFHLSSCCHLFIPIVNKLKQWRNVVKM